MKKRNKFLSATLASTAVFAIASVVSAATPYTDVEADHSYAGAINLVSSHNYLAGYPDGTFKPAKNMTRGEFATVVYRILNVNAVQTVEGFKDVSSSSFYAEAVHTLAGLNVLHGYPDNTFKPNQQITRAEAAKVLALAFNLPISNTPSSFEDVPASSSLSKYIKALTDAGLVVGTSATTFSPNLPIKRQDVAAIVARNLIPAEEDNYTLSILHVNDTHARVEEMPKLATAVKQLRAEKQSSLVLHAGDVFSGTLYFNEFKGQADLEMMNYIGFDAMTLGNHEFDLGSSPEGHQALAQFIGNADFPFISANTDFSGDSDLASLQEKAITEQFVDGKLYDGIVKEVNGEKIGIFGLTTPETELISSPEGVTFTNYIDAAQEAVETFEGLGINKIIALTHIGYDDAANVDNDLQLAAHVDGIDVIVGGHTHTTLNEPVAVTKDAEGNEKVATIIVQAYQHAEHLGTLDIEFDEDGNVVDYEGLLIALKDVTPDEQATAILNKYKPTVQEIMTQEIGLTLSEALATPRESDPGNTELLSVRKNETILGNIITDAMRTKAQAFSEDKVVMAVQNGGGIRAPIPAGNVTTGHIITVLPYGNTLSLIHLTGAEIKEAFEHSLSGLPKESGGFLHVSGAKVTFDSSKAVGERVVSIELLNEDGTYSPLVDASSYTIATNFFTAKGGDSFKMFEDAYTEGRVTDLGLSDWENLAEHLTTDGFVVPTATEGRLVDIAAE